VAAFPVLLFVFGERNPRLTLGGHRRPGHPAPQDNIGG